jgi:biopolymer transport protein ExbD
MSHGGGGNDEVVEPSLTPLLDLVLQLLMFFLIVANFIEEQNNKDILLPEATTAVPIEPQAVDVLPLNVDQEGKLVLAENEAISSDQQITRFLTDKYNEFKSDRGEKGAKDIAVVVRGDARADFKYIYRVMTAARQAGFSKIELRANTHSVAQ